jgi:error-prone DNA polymerase
MAEKVSPWRLTAFAGARHLSSIGRESGYAPEESARELTPGRPAAISALLGAVGERNAIFSLPHGRGDEAKHGSGPDPRGALGRKPRDIYIPDLRIEGAINVKTRDFR